MGTRSKTLCRPPGGGRAHGVDFKNPGASLLHVHAVAPRGSLLRPHAFGCDRLLIHWLVLIVPTSPGPPHICRVILEQSSLLLLYYYYYYYMHICKYAPNWILGSQLSEYAI